MVKNEGCFTRQLTSIKGVLHQEKDVNITGVGLGSDKRAKDDEASQVTRSNRQGVDVLQSAGYNTALRRVFAKMVNDLSQGSLMDTGWQVTFVVEIWPVFHPTLPIAFYQYFTTPSFSLST